MFYLAGAILLAVVLFLVDRNAVWPQAWRIFKKTAIIATALAVVAAIGFGVYIYVSDRHAQVVARQAVIEEQEEAQAEQRQEIQQQAQAKAAQEAHERADEQQAATERATEAQAKIAAKKLHRKDLLQLHWSQVPASDGHTTDIRIYNNSAETIKSVTFEFSFNEGQQPIYRKLLIKIQPGKYDLFSSGYIEGPRSQSPDDYCEIETGMYDPCDGGTWYQALVLHAPSTDGTVTITLIDYEAEN